MKVDDETFKEMTKEVYTIWEHTVLQGIALLMNAICDPNPKISLYTAVKDVGFKADVRHDDVWRLLTLDYFGVYRDRLRETTLQHAVERARKILIACEREDLVTLYEQVMEEVENVTARKAIIRERQQRERTKEPRLRPNLVLQPTNKAAPDANVSTRLIPDAPGQDLKPDPIDVATVEQLVELLRELHHYAGDVPLRELARRIDQKVAHSTFSVMLSNHNKLPRQRTMVAFVRALGCTEEDVSSWVSALRRVENIRRGRF
ncbi:hypothetical protein [Actinomadura sp. 7K507]|uniref:hypothetical protein n=1 Tax=Actinomadura sp. 7K507 TaxID=2530365 RepID=UPI001053E82E|nr:hypothetical protein [Actinomadura sp. 7K507]TDC96030.1 hypothetical protein E1285_06305 [Actinomadura sp. 7K507]